MLKKYNNSPVTNIITYIKSKASSQQVSITETRKLVTSLPKIASKSSTTKWLYYVIFYEFIVTGLRNNRLTLPIHICCNRRKKASC